MVGFFQNDVTGFDGTGQNGGKGDVKLVALFFSFLPAAAASAKPCSLSLTSRQPVKKVFRVPFALSVTDEY